ncbi:protein disulfide isomerase FrnE [Alpinimonas psychrophila]|uniref:Putative DsbA family dithiol-disulfide isomerase n=1 Tax=Alpinimonas psychrophila TaxID=748908 RepID=A0A7W3JSU4_9MICO|nr:DsbA family oxidoreductase [Alpinimonas psychrophila]MBA8828613.1 putative DsbA family dithiol-disulfide isomerase [Alpinimonas psychrophila]
MTDVKAPVPLPTLSESAPIKVDIWSDVQCPWCYIGKRKFEKGVELFGEDVEVEYHSFELAPDTPVDFDGSPVDYLSQRKGLPVDQVHEMLARVTEVARSVGLEYNYDAVHQTNTIKAHELMHFAKKHGMQAEMKERLLSAYFVEGKHVGRIDDLADLAQEIGLDRAAAHAALTDARYLSAVKDDVAQAEAYGISGVPFYVIDGKYGVSGAQNPETFQNVLEQAREERQTP